MTELTRRGVLAGTAVLAGSLAGCSGAGGGGPGATPSETATPPASSPPTCESSSADQLLTIRPLGVTVRVADRERADAVATDARERVGAEGAVRVLETTRGAAVEIDAGHLSPADARTAFSDASGVLAVAEGRSRPTVRAMAEHARTALAESVDAERVDVTVVGRGPTPYFVAAVAGTGGDAVLGDASSIEFRVATEDGERTLAGGAAIASASGEERDRPRVSFSLTGAGRRRFARVLGEAGALESPSDAAIRAYFRGERVWEGSLRRNLAREIESGEWSGEFVLAVANAAKMREIETAMNVVSFDVATRTSFRRCGESTP